MNDKGGSAAAPRFSVVIAAYDQPELLAEAVASVAAQSYPAHEVIVVDDGSLGDGVRDAVDGLLGVRFIRQHNCGRSIAKNTGAFAASGEWLCFLDQDDLWHPDRLAGVRRHLAANPSCRALRHPVWFFGDGSPSTESGFGFARDFVASSLATCLEASLSAASRNDFSYLDIEGKSYESLLGRMIGFSSATTLDRETFFRAGGFVPSIDCADDWLMYLTVARLTEWELINERLAFVRLHARQSTNTMSGIATTDLAAKIAVWYGSRPFPRHTAGIAHLEELSAYRRLYRRQLQAYIWATRRSGDPQQRRALRRMGALLLRPRDRLFAELPPGLAARLAQTCAERRCNATLGDGTPPA